MKIVIKVVSFLLSAFIGAALSYFVFSDCMDTIDVQIFGKPEIIVDIYEIHPLENEQQLENFALMFGTANGQGTILAAQMNQPELTSFGGILIPVDSVLMFMPVDFGRNGNNLEYFIDILNLGNRKARDIRITFDGDMLERDYVDERIDSVKCNGINCDIWKKELAPDDKVSMFVKARTPPIANVNIGAKGNYDSFVDYRKLYARIILEGESIQIFLDENKVAELPPLNENSNLLKYYYLPEENKWISE